MKKLIRTVAALVLALGVCFSLCSCQTLDNMRDRQAFFDKNKNIVYKGDTFRPINIANNDLLALDNKSLKVTERDVPVLLSDYEGQEANLSCDGKIISTTEDMIYCREDFYDYLKAADANHQLDTFGFLPRCDSDEITAGSLVMLSGSETEELSAIIERSEKGTYDTFDSDMDGDYNDIGYLYLCSKDKIFGVYSYDVFRVDKTYFLSNGDEICKIADADRAIFDRYAEISKSRS